MRPQAALGARARLRVPHGVKQIHHHHALAATSARPPALTVQKALETAKWWERLIGLPVQYHWAKAHSGLLGNEQADRLAKQGAQQPGRPTGGVTLAWAQQQAKDWPTQESARRWHLEAPTRYVELAIQPAPRKGPKELQIARSSLARLVAARTGHGDFAAYRQRFAFADGDNSRNRCSCGALKKPEHFFYCRIARRRYGGPTGPPRRLCPEYLLGDPEGGLPLRCLDQEDQVLPGNLPHLAQRGRQRRARGS